MKLSIGNTYTKVEFTDENGGQELEIVREATKISIRYYVKQKGARHGEYKERDIHYFRDETKDFPTGLLPRVFVAAQAVGASVSVADLREKASETVHENLNLMLPDLPTTESDYSFQELAVKDAAKLERGLMHYPTGAGKTVIIARIIEHFKKSSIVIVPNLQLVYQTYEKFQEYFGASNIGMMGDGKRINTFAPIVIATQQTLYSLFKRSEIRKTILDHAELMKTNLSAHNYYMKYFAEHVWDCVTKYRSEYFVHGAKNWRQVAWAEYDSLEDVVERFENKIATEIDIDVAVKAVQHYETFDEIVGHFDLMFIDECHHVATTGTQNVRNKYTGRWEEKENLSNTWWDVAMAIPAYYRFGMSATLNTPDSPNNQFILESVTGRIISSIGVSDLIDRKVLCGVDVTMIKMDEETYGLWQTKYDYEEIDGKLVRVGIKEHGAYESNILNNARRNELIVSIALKKQEEGRRVLIIVDRIKDQGKAIARELADNCVFLTGANKKKERDDGLRVVARDNKILIGTIFKEGFDMPAIDTLILAGGGKSMKATVQKVGRVLRIAPGKYRAQLFDFYDADDSMCEKHSDIRKEIYEAEDRYGFQIIHEKDYENESNNKISAGQAVSG